MPKTEHLDEVRKPASPTPDVVIEKVFIRQVNPIELSHPKCYAMVAMGIEESSPDWIRGSEMHMLALMNSIRNGELQAWFIVDEDNRKIGLITTYISEWKALGKSTLMINSFRAYPRIAPEAWEPAFESLRAFALERMCDFIEAVTVNPQVRKIAEHLGFRESVRLTMEV